MEIVKRGSRGDAALMAQMLLNDRLIELGEGELGGYFDPLVTDGIFGKKSEALLVAVIAAKERMSLPPVIDARMWKALGLKIEFEHRITLVGQYKGGMCWNAAAAMILGGPMSVTSGGALLGKRQTLQPGEDNIRTFADALGWRIVPPPLPFPVFVAKLRAAPLWMAGEASFGRTTAGHAMVVSGLWSDGDPSGGTTLLRIHDPWPGPRGRIYRTLFFSQKGIKLPGNTWFKPHTFLTPA
jgi:hypothetical protein